MDKYCSQAFLEHLPPQERIKQYILQLQGELTPTQLLALSWIQWTFYGGRARGATYTIMTAAVIEAINNPNQKIRCYDHCISYLRFNRDAWTSQLSNVIRNAELPSDLFEISLQGNEVFITYVPKKEI